MISVEITTPVSIGSIVVFILGVWRVSAQYTTLKNLQKDMITHAALERAHGTLKEFFRTEFISKESVGDNFASRFSEIETRHEVMWKVFVTTGLGAGLRGGLLEKKSPLRWSYQAIVKHADYLDRVCKWYQENTELNDIDLVLAIEKNFEMDLLKISKEYEFQHAAVLLATVFYCRPQSDLFAKFQTNEWQANTTGPIISETEEKALKLLDKEKCSGEEAETK
jgi:hypothetical protein